MKFNYLDRLFLLLLLLALLSLSIFSVLLFAGVFSMGAVATQLVSLIHQPLYITVSIAVVSGVIAIICLRLIICVFSSSQPKVAPTILLNATEDGEVKVSTEVINDLAIKCSRKSVLVKDVTCKVKNTPEGNMLYIRYILSTDTVIHEFVSEMQQKIKTYVEHYAGVPVKSVNIYIDNNKKANKAGVINERTLK